MSQKMTTVLGGVAAGITFVFVIPALKNAGFGSIWIILICGMLGGGFSLTLMAINSLLSKSGKE